MTPAWHVAAHDIPSFSNDGGTIFAVTTDRELRAYHSQTGEIRWKLMAPKGQNFTFERAYLNDVIVGVEYGDGYSKGLCRVDALGTLRWCQKLERPINRLDTGQNGTGLLYFDAYYNARVLDPDTGLAVGDWLSGGEMHIYYELGEPHDTEYYPGATLLGKYGGGKEAVYVVATGQELIGLSLGAGWRLDLNQARATLGAAGNTLMFAHRMAPYVAGTERIFSVAGILVVLDEGGNVQSQRAMNGQLFMVRGEYFTVEHRPDHSLISKLVPQTGLPLWTTRADGFGVVLGTNGWFAERLPEDGRDRVVVVDSASGATVREIPLRGFTGSLSEYQGGVVVSRLVEGGIRYLREQGVVWEFLDPMGNAELLAGVGVRYPAKKPTELFDLEDGKVLATFSGAVLESMGDVLLVSELGGYDIYVVTR